MAIVKDLVVLFMVCVGIPALAALFCFWRPSRKIGFFCLVFFSIYNNHLSLNLVSREWYRGSTRGFEFAILDIVAAALLLAMYLRPARGSRKWYWPAGIMPMLVYFFVCICSVLISSPKLFAMFEVLKVFRGILIFVTAAIFIQSERELRVLVWAVACIVCWEGLLALKMRYVDHIYRIQATFDHPNSLSMFMVLSAPILYASAVSKWSHALRLASFIAVGLACAAVILTVSRSGVFTIGTVIMLTVIACFSFRLNLQNILITATVLAALAFGIAFSWKTLSQRFASMESEYSEQGGAMNRGSYLRLADLIRQDHFFGIGLNNWSYAVSETYGPMIGLPYKAYNGTDEAPDQTVDSGMVDYTGTSLDDAQAPPAHNLGALTLGEIGVPGLIVFCAVWFRWLQMGSVFLLWRPPDPLRRIALGIFFGTVAVAFQSWTEWEYRQAPIMLYFHLMLGTLAGLCMIRRDDIRWARRQRNRRDDADQAVAA